MASQPPGTGLAIFGGQGGAALPAHIANFFEEEGSNIAPRTTVPSLSPEGKTWTIALNGNKTKLQRQNADGDLEPLPIMKVVVLDYNKNRGRSYYEGDYDPNNVSSPICWSDDGVAPDASLPGPFAAGTAVEPGSSRKISAACATCPMAVKGSKVDNTGKARTACSQHRMLALIPDPALGLKDIPALRLKIAMTSDWDKESPDQEAQGWLSWSRYVDWLTARGCKHTAAIVTKMKFDPNAAFPKIFFSAERPLDAAELAIIGPLVKAEETKKLLGGTWTPAGVDGVPKEQQQVAQAQPATDQLAVPQEQPGIAAPPVQYRMADGETFTEEQYIGSGWTREQLIAAGKMVPIAVAIPEPAPVPPPPPPPPPQEPEGAIVLGEAAAPAAAPAEPAGLVIAEPAAATTSAPEKPAAPPPVQEPAQAAAPAPAPTPAAPEPPAAAAAAAEAAPAASADVPEDVAALLTEWQ